MENDSILELLKAAWDSLTEEQKAKAKECKTAEALVQFAGQEGIELPDELLDAVAGGYLVKKTDQYGSVSWHVYDEKWAPRQSFKWDEYDKAREYAIKNNISTEIRPESDVPQFASFC